MSYFTILISFQQIKAKELAYRYLKITKTPCTALPVCPVPWIFLVHPCGIGLFALLVLLAMKLK